MEELRKLRKSINVANAKISYLSDGFKDLKESFNSITHDLDLFIEVYETNQSDVEKRLSKLEKHLGLHGS